VKTLVCGGLRIDFLISAQGEVRLNQMGGNAIYAAVGARIWTDEVHLVAKAGDNFPQEWLDSLALRGVSGDHVRRVPGWQEMRTFYAYTDEKTRVDHNPEEHFRRVGLPLPPELEGYTYSLFETRNPNSPLVLRGPDAPTEAADVAHIAPLALVTHAELVRHFHESGVKQITVDPGEYERSPDAAAAIQAYCSHIAAFLPSELEVSLLLGNSSTPYEAAEVFAGWGAPLVVIKRGPDGCLLYERDGRRFTSVPAFPTTVVDVTGAGDSFGGGFAVGLRQTGDPLRAALMGTVSASFTIEGYGALHCLDASPEAARQRLDWLADRVR
jgi:ribokinase